MTLSEAIRVVKAQAIVEHEASDADLSGCFAADLMSDVLAFARSGSVLVTGLTTDQTVRTVAIKHLAGVIVVEGKEVGSDMVEAAIEHEVPVYRTPLSKYETCGRLLEAGLRPYRAAKPV